MALTLRNPGAPRKRRPRRRNNLIAWIFVLPFAVIFLLYTAIPVIVSLFLSFTDAKSTDLQNLFGVNFLGFGNYAMLLSNTEFLRSILNTLIFVIVGVPLTMGVGFILAVTLNNGIRRFRGTFRALFYAPVVSNVVSVALIFQYAFNQNGTVNSFLASIGFAGPNWLGDTHYALPVVILLGIWRNFGTAMLLFLAGLQAIPEDVYEAAALDGAGAFRRLWSVTLPLLRPSTLLVSVLLCVFFLQVFDEPYLLTKGGPLSSTESMALFTYNQFGFGNFGVSSAASYLLLILVGAVSFVQFRLFRAKS